MEDRYESWIWIHRVEDGYGYTIKDKTIGEAVAWSFELKDFSTTEHDLEARLARLRKPE